MRGEFVVIKLLSMMLIVCHDPVKNVEHKKGIVENSMEKSALPFLLFHSSVSFTTIIKNYFLHQAVGNIPRHTDSTLVPRIPL